MRRFVERDFPAGSLESDAAELLRDAGPPRGAPEAKQRVRARLLESRVRPPRRRRLAFAPAMALVALGLGTAAAATVGVRWWRAERAPSPVVSDEASRRPRVAPTRARAGLGPPVEQSEDVPAPPLEVLPDPAAPSSTPPSAPPLRAKRARASEAITETALLFEATRALRSERDAARAGALLDEYFRRFPRGALGEEALAVAVEAAAARGDARVHALGRRYLQRYPDGHYREAVERALDAGRPGE